MQNDCSLAALLSVDAANLREYVYGLIKSEPITCDELEERSGLKHQTASARVNELMRAGRIASVGTRKTRSGRKANVWSSL